MNESIRAGIMPGRVEFSMNDEAADLCVIRVHHFQEKLLHLLCIVQKLCKTYIS